MERTTCSNKIRSTSDRKYFIARMPLEFLLGIYCVCCGFLSGIANSIIIFTNMNSLVTPSTAFLLLLCFFESLLSFVDATLLSGNLIHQSYSWSYTVCQFQFAVTLVACCGSLMTVASIAFERFRSTTSLETMSWRSISIWVFSIVLSSVILPFTPYFLSSPHEFITLDENQWVCLGNWAGSDPGSILAATLSLTIIAFSWIVVCFCYGKVYWTFRTATSEKRKGKGNIQKIIFYRCVIITISFIFFWSGYLIKIFYHLITKQRVSTLLAAIASCLVITNSLMNAVLLFFLDNRIRLNVVSFFYKSGVSKSSRPNDSNETHSGLKQSSSVIATREIPTVII